MVNAIKFFVYRLDGAFGAHDELTSCTDTCKSLKESSGVGAIQVVF
jgi:hypothetical protein